VTSSKGIPATASAIRRRGGRVGSVALGGIHLLLLVDVLFQALDLIGIEVCLVLSSPLTIGPTGVSGEKG
jgi:hypothetical protein